MNRITHRFLHFIVLVFAFLVSCQQHDNNRNILKKSTENWQYLGLELPQDKPIVFSPDIISTARDERDFTQSSTGNTILYSTVLPANNLSVIMYLYFDGFFWSEPEVARFSGQYKDLEPAFSPDGSKLFFISKRPLDNSIEEKDYDIWYIDIAGNGWANPINLGSPVNTSSNEYYPSVSSSGNLYFTASYDDTFGKEDIYYSQFENGNYSEPVNLGESINSELYEFNSFISPDESYLIFSSFGRDDEFGGGDLYISYRNDDGTWSKAKNMGKQINSDKIDYCPFVTPDEKYLFFTSERENYAFTNRNQKRFGEILKLANSIENGLGNIYWVKFEKDKWR
jgi:hypothetical protein